MPINHPKVVVRRAGQFSSEDIHRVLFGARTPKTRTVSQLKEGIRRYVRKRYSRGLIARDGWVG